MKRARIGLAVAVLTVGPGALAQTVTGNPITDGWTVQGNSLANGVYARSGGGAPENALSFDVYSRSYSISAGSNLLFSPNWLVGDTVLGLGIVANSLYNITMSPMIKFGGVGSTYAPDSDGIAGPLQDGRVNNSLGHGGEGSVLLRITGLYNRTGGELNSPANNGAFLVPNSMRYYDSAEVNFDGNAGLRDAARMVTLFDTADADEATSFMGLLNVSALARLGGASINDLPAVGAASVASFMRSTGSDGTEAIAAISAVPEPSAYLMTIAGLGVVGWAARRRSAKLTASVA